jgi:hypothetical protein
MIEILLAIRDKKKGKCPRFSQLIMFESESSQTLLMRKGLLQNEADCLFSLYVYICWDKENKQTKRNLHSCNSSCMQHPLMLCI